MNFLCQEERIVPPIAILENEAKAVFFCMLGFTVLS